MDDVISGAHSIKEAKQKQTIELCKVVGFSLRKWMSNCTRLLNHLPAHLRATENLSCNGKLLSINIFGISWHPLEDTFHFHVDIEPQAKVITKRYILLNITRLFDPLGWLGPVVIRAKLLMQSLWLLKIGWDSPFTQGNN